MENSKGEAGVGQHELNVRYAKPLEMSDRHVVYKQCLKEITDQVICLAIRKDTVANFVPEQEGQSVTFMAKPFTDATGSGCHVHLSLWRDKDQNAFVGDNDISGIKCSDVFRWFLGGKKEVALVISC